MQSKKSHAMPQANSIRYAICIDNSDYPASLEILKLYRMLPDLQAEKDGDIRVIDESGEDYLYPADYFISVDLPPTTLNILSQKI